MQKKCELKRGSLDPGWTLVKSCSIRILPNKGATNLGTVFKAVSTVCTAVGTVRESEYLCTLLYTTFFLFSQFI